MEGGVQGSFVVRARLLAAGTQTRSPRPGLGTGTRGTEPWQSPGAGSKPGRAASRHAHPVPAGHEGCRRPWRERQPRAAGAAGCRGAEGAGARLGWAQAAGGQGRAGPHSPIAVGVLGDVEGDGGRPGHPAGTERVPAAPLLPPTRRPARQTDGRQPTPRRRHPRSPRLPPGTEPVPVPLRAGARGRRERKGPRG